MHQAPGNLWSPQSWRARPGADVVAFPDEGAVEHAVARLADLPPLVTSWEVERLRAQLAQAETGERFLLQGGDCAESFEDCTPRGVTSKLKILLQMSLVLVHATKRPVIRVGRFAGQYAKPRSSPTETRVVEGRETTLPSYFGDLINDAEFSPAARRPDPSRLLQAYTHSALTLNFVRSLVEGGFADVHHPEYWNLSFLRRASLSPARLGEYERLTTNLADGLRFMEALGEATIHELSRVEFFTSHEGLCLHYEAAQTRQVPRREGYFDLTTHLPWIGARTRRADGAHAEFFRGVRNPVGVKLDARATPDELRRLADVLNPANEPGKLVLIPRLGSSNVERVLPELVRAMRRDARRCVWSCDPMHGNTTTTGTGLKTRSFEDIRLELERTCDVHRALGGRLGGVHFELTGDDVTECVGGAAGVTEASLSSNYASRCDPRLNYQQALELAFVLGAKLTPEPQPWGDGRGTPEGNSPPA